MEVLFKKSFIKDFNKLPNKTKEEVKHICFEILPKTRSVQGLKDWPTKKLSGFKNYYRIKVGHYRIGFKLETNSIVFMRVLHRKDIYRLFP